MRILRSVSESFLIKKSDAVSIYTASLISLLVYVLIFYFPLFRVVGTLDNSLPYHFFIWIRPDRENLLAQIRKYRYVEIKTDRFRNYEPIKKKGALFLVKKAVCLPGDILEVIGERFFCNGKFVGAVHPSAPAKPFLWNGKIPEGVIFAAGTHPKSFDSRYIGFVKFSEITGILIPLF